MSKLTRSYSYKFEGSDTSGAFMGLGCIGFIILSVVAWCTHVIWIIQKLASDEGATAGQMVLGALGAFMPPVGVVHGFILWFT